MIRDRKRFLVGLAMAVTFLGFFAFMFTPSFNGGNAFQAADNLFNSIAMGSMLKHWPELQEKAQECRDKMLRVNLDLSGETAAAARALLTDIGLGAADVEGRLLLTGSQERLMSAAINDAQAVFQREEETVVARRGRSGRETLYLWWRIYHDIIFQLKDQGQFEAAGQLEAVQTRGIEVGYNFHNVEYARAGENAVILFLVLVFYVAYTAWWGFALLFLAEGFGLRLSAGRKSAH